MSMQTGRYPAAKTLGTTPADLPFEGNIGSFEGATTWINSQRLTPAGLRGRVAVVQFWTYTCINWLRTQAYNRAWSRRYRDKGFVTVVGGVVKEQRMFQLIRQAKPIRDLRFEIELPDGGAEAFCFTFG